MTGATKRAVPPPPPRDTKPRVRSPDIPPPPKRNSRQTQCDPHFYCEDARAPYVFENASGTLCVIEMGKEGMKEVPLDEAPGAWLELAREDKEKAEKLAKEDKEKEYLSHRGLIVGGDDLFIE